MYGKWWGTFEGETEVKCDVIDCGWDVCLLLSVLAWNICNKVTNGHTI